jgi:heparinase II/III-like protein
VVDDRPQSVPAGPFQWQTVARTTLRVWQTGEGFDYFEASHDGFRPLEHRRHVFAIHGDVLIVADWISGSGHHAAAAHWHIDPQWTARFDGHFAILEAGDDRIDFCSPHGSLERFWADDRSGLGWNSPVYGRIEPATTLRVTQRGEAPFWMVSVFGLNRSNAVTGVEMLPIRTGRDSILCSTAIRISRLRSIDIVLIGVRHYSAPASQGVAAWPPGPRAAAALAISDIQTDAQKLWCSIGPGSRIARAALVEGSFVRAAVRDAQERLPCVVSQGSSNLRTPRRSAATRAAS